MAQNKKRKPVSKGKTQPKFQLKRKKTFSERVFVVLGILIALSMIVSLIASFVPTHAG